MKKRVRQMMVSCLFAVASVCVSLLSVSPLSAQGTSAQTAPANMKKVVYKDVEETVFLGNDGVLQPEEALKNMGMGFLQGASVTYNEKKKTLTLVNTEEEHKLMEEVLAQYNKNKPKERTIEFIEACKIVSGKPDKNAKLYVFFCVSKVDLGVLEEECCAYDGAALYGGDKKFYKDNVKAIAKLQRKKEVEVLLLMEAGCEVKKVKKMAKLLKLKAPILEQGQTRGAVQCINSGEVYVVDRVGNRIETDCGVYWGVESSNCLEAVTDWLKDAS